MQNHERPMFGFILFGGVFHIFGLPVVGNVLFALAVINIVLTVGDVIVKAGKLKAIKAASTPAQIEAPPAFDPLAFYRAEVERYDKIGGPLAEEVARDFRRLVVQEEAFQDFQALLHPAEPQEPAPPDDPALAQKRCSMCGGYGSEGAVGCACEPEGEEFRPWNGAVPADERLVCLTCDGMGRMADNRYSCISCQGKGWQQDAPDTLVLEPRECRVCSTTWRSTSDYSSCPKCGYVQKLDDPMKAAFNRAEAIMKIVSDLLEKHGEEIKKTDLFEPLWNEKVDHHVIAQNELHKVQADIGMSIHHARVMVDMGDDVTPKDRSRAIERLDKVVNRARKTIQDL